LFCNGSSFWSIIGLLAAVRVSLELAGQFAVAVLYWRNGMPRGIVSSLLTIVILYFDSQRDTSYKSKLQEKKEDFRNPLFQDCVYPLKAHF
jgi:hypothetical protein